MRILLLEDEKMLRMAIKEYLEHEGHQVDSHSDGTTALETIKKKNVFDLLILDINTPSLSGLELLEALNSLKIQTPSIIISAIQELDEIEKAYALGCLDYLKKPFHLQELYLHINRALSMTEKSEKHRIKISKRYSFDQDSNTLYFDNDAQMLSNLHTKIIAFLSKNIGRTIDYDSLRYYVWENEMIDNASQRAEINRLKKQLKEEIIVNVRGLGYRIETIS